MAINLKFLPLLFKKQTNLVRFRFDKICKGDRISICWIRSDRRIRQKISDRIEKPKESPCRENYC